ncbi:Transcription factor FER-LIKE IRON DEFICIENCY-INDUCED TRANSCRIPTION FACTOR [Platanthera zijinensis]|uniref:Transcription factor FER-LIKE IRON DEFICIENCY-INDUCED TRANSCRIPTION FACTOR n=1 Tax=Platanthera zijinensis TaxID=2320716 RepID=A0AAP0B6C6_9ASPA
MDSLFSFPVEDDHMLFQSGGDFNGYDFPIFDDKLLQEQMFDVVVDWECTSNFGTLGAPVDANPDDEIPPVEASCRGGGGGDRADVMKPSRDRSKTIVSERRRRGRMKERLYELRSMVPNITKMDKSSIIGDAVAYVRELQGQEKKLAEEISNLESSSTCREEKSISKGNILGVMAHQVGEKRFQVMIECSAEDGVSASSLYNAVHALECLRLESAAITHISDRYVCTLTFDCRGVWEEMNAGKMKYWVVDSLIKDGFPFITNSTYYY